MRLAAAFSRGMRLENSVERRAIKAAFVALILLSIWVRMAFPVNARGYAWHDDLLFMRLAANLGMGQWLGAYDNLTHAKGMVYSVFILINHGLGISLKLSEHLVYLFSAWLFAVTTGKALRSRGAGLLVFAVLAFIPLSWNPEIGGRVVRENLYVSLSLLVLSLAIECWVLDIHTSVVDQLRGKWKGMVALGAVAGLFWLTREEGMWLAPATGLCLVYWVWRHRTELRGWRVVGAFLLLPVIAMAAMVGIVNGINYAYYGVFRNNDFRSADFQAGYGALARIRHDDPQRYVPFPRDARERAYAMSAAARELQPFLEGEGGERWRVRACSQTQVVPCPEIHSGWFVWALREAVAEAGHYADARKAQSFYQRLAAEIDSGCREHAGDCLSARQTLVPPWRDEYLGDTARAAVSVFGTLRELRGVSADVGYSTGTPEALQIVAIVTNAQLAHPAQPPGTMPPAASPGDNVRRSAALALSEVERKISAYGLALALVGWAVWVVAGLALRRLDAGLIVACALVAATASRVGLLAFLEATSIPSNNILYLAPVVPMSLALVPLVGWGLFRLVRPSREAQ